MSVPAIPPPNIPITPAPGLLAQTVAPSNTPVVQTATQATPQPGQVDPNTGLPWTQPVTPPTGTVAVAPATNLAPTTLYNPNLLSADISNIIGQNSPIMQRADAVANETSNNTGLLNSSMAVGAAQNAVLGAAIPIAEGDVAAQNAALQSNQSALNAAASTQAGLTQQTTLANTGATNTALMAQLAQENATQLAGLNTKYSSFINANSNASTLYNDSMSQIGAIQNNVNMDATTKSNAINQIIGMLQNGLDMFSSINGLNLGSGLNFNSMAPTETGPAAVVPQGSTTPGPYNPTTLNGLLNNPTNPITGPAAPVAQSLGLPSPGQALQNLGL